MGFNEKLEKSGILISEDQNIEKRALTWSDFGISEEKENKEDKKDKEYIFQECPKCSQKTLFADYKTGDFFCEHCHYSGSVFTSKLSQKLSNNKVFKNWWSSVPLEPKLKDILSKKYLITDETQQRLKLTTQKHYFKKENKIRQSLVIPAFTTSGDVNNYFFVPINKDLSLDNYYESLNGNLLGLDNLTSNDQNAPVYITNSPLDYITLCQIDDDTNMKIICIPPNIDTINISNNEQWDFLKLNEESILKSKKFITVFPNNDYSEKIKQEICRRLGYHQCSYIKLDDYKEDVTTINYEDISINDILREGGKEEDVRLVLDHPEHFPIKGLHQLNEFEDDIDDIFENGLKPGYSWGYKQLDPYLTLKMGQWTLVTGIPGHGKSSFVEAGLINMAYLHDFKVAMFSPENTPLSRFYINLMQKASGKSYSKDEKNPAPKISREEHNYWKKWINNRFFSILPDDDNNNEEDALRIDNKGSNLSLTGILSLAAKAVYRHGVKIVVIDPWTEVEHERPNGLTELEYLSKSISLVKRFAVRYDVHVIMVAHPTKLQKDALGRYPIPTPYDIAGGAHWRNKGDNIISIYRNAGFPDEDITDIYIQKIRFKECGRLGSYSIRADVNTGYYYDDIIQEKRIDVLRRFNSFGKEQSLPSEEEILSQNMRYAEDFNLRELPREFNQNINSNKRYETDYSYSTEPTF